MLRTQTVVVTPGWEALLNAHGLERVDAVYALDRGDLVTQSSSTEVRRLTLPDGTGWRTLYLKKYWISQPKQLWSGMFRGTFLGRSKVRREYDNLRRLRHWGLDAPCPVAYGEERCGGWLRRSFLLSEGIPHPLPLHLFIRDVLSALAPTEQTQRRRELVERLAAYTRRLHAQRFMHHDYFWRNIILSGNRLDHFYLIDAHKGRRWWPGRERCSRAHDLATLDAPAPLFFRRSERLRFFLNYAGHDHLTAADKRLVRRVLFRAKPLRERQYQRVRGALAARR